MDRDTVIDLVERERTAAHDPTVQAVIRQYRVEPYPVELDWSFGQPYRRHACWVVLDGLPWNPTVGVVHCDEGFGPDRPWGLVFLRGPNRSMGIPDQWYATLADFVQDNWLPEERVGHR
ncbi:hypothetical protein [Gemmata sp.]|uniref:hypothetical protein n=1 Tax=Gemmata sp. TaxID=1914242 RepID=UPI003F7077EA